MKALSVCQPWAYLIVNGYKNVENRRWQTSYRGPLLIHAGRCNSPAWRRSRFADQAMLEGVYGRLRASGLPVPQIPEDLPSGGIVGQVTLVDCVERAEGMLPFADDSITHGEARTSPWFEGPIGWLMHDQRPLPFMPAPGKLSIFEFNLPSLELPSTQPRGRRRA